MKTLVLLRHAKSSWDDSSLRDFDRPLAERGIKDAPRIGRAIKERALAPDLIVCSTAVRARQTLDLVSKGAGFECEKKFEEPVYGASSAELMKLVRGLPDSASTVVLVGHNPGFEDLLGRLTDGRDHMPTCATACISLPAETWSDVDDGEGKVKWMLTPKGL